MSGIFRKRSDCDLTSLYFLFCMGKSFLDNYEIRIDVLSSLIRIYLNVVEF